MTKSYLLECLVKGWWSWIKNVTNLSIVHICLIKVVSKGGIESI
jgi:hypothetical protein